MSVFIKTKESIKVTLDNGDQYSAIQIIFFNDPSDIRKMAEAISNFLKEKEGKPTKLSSGSKQEDRPQAAKKAKRIIAGEMKITRNILMPWTCSSWERERTLYWNSSNRTKQAENSHRARGPSWGVPMGVQENRSSIWISFPFRIFLIFL